MTKIRTTLTIDDEVLRAVKIQAARTGRGDSEVIEAALRRDLGIETVPGIVANGNSAQGNGNPLQCLNVSCA